MTTQLVRTPALQGFIKTASGLTVDGGSDRMKQITQRLLTDLFQIVEDFDVSPDEFWGAVNYLNRLGASGEAGLLAAGLGFEHYIDLRLDAQDAAAGLSGGTPRTIEGPLYVAGAPLSKGYARLDTDPDADAQVLFMRGCVKDTQGNPIAGAVVDVWHANSRGMYSHFDDNQSPFNLRRRITTDAEGRYEFRSTMPVGYGCPPEGPTQNLLDQLGRHGRRPAHIHFFVKADSHRTLTTQINIDGDEYLHDDFAYATRDDLIPAVTQVTDADAIKTRGLEAPYAEIEFDFTLQALNPAVSDGEVTRVRAAA